MKLISIALLFIWSFPLLAQDTKLKSKHNHYELSPYNFSSKREIPFIATGIGVLIGSAIIKYNNNTEPYTETELNDLDRNDVNSFDRPATNKYDPHAAQLSDIIRTGVVVLPVILIFNHHTKKDIRGLALMTVEVMSINFGITNSVKHIVNRTRPYVYNENAPLDIRMDGQSKLSFFSGHTSHTAAVSFMFAKIINDYHPNMSLKGKLGLWSGAALVPAAAAYLRVQSGKHFPTDVMVGYGIGATIGWLVPHLHKVDTPLSIAPYSFIDGKGENGKGVSLTYLF